MKRTKKVAGMLLAMLMILCMTITAFAANEGKAVTNDGIIVIDNATVGKKYAIYKVFDLTYAADAVAYSYTKSSITDAFFIALTGADSPFTLTASATNENIYSVALQEGKTAKDVSSFLKNNEEKLSEIGTRKAANTTVKFSGLSYGYYYISSSLGSVATIDSVKPNATVIDKNQTPGWNPENPAVPDQTGTSGKFVADAVDGTYSKTNTAEIKDTVYFKINAFAPKYAGDKLVAAYVFTDTPDNGFTYNGDLKVMLGKQELVADKDYSVIADQKLTVTVNAGTIENYPSDAQLSLYYSAKVDKDAVYDNVNSVNMKWTVYPNDSDDKPQTDQLPYDPNAPSASNKPTDPKNPEDSKTDTFVLGFNLQKYKNEVLEANKLTGAKFKLYDAKTAGKEIPVVATDVPGEYRVAEAGEAGVEIEAGTAKIFGLDAKTYYLEEIAAPDGFNLLKERVEVSLTADETSQTKGIMTATTNVINLSGTLLPSTGGRGTTFLYALGGFMVVGAAMALLVKKYYEKIKIYHIFSSCFNCRTFSSIVSKN